MSMRTLNTERKARRWAASLVLVAAGFVAGTVLVGSGFGPDVTGLRGGLAAPVAQAQTVDVGDSRTYIEVAEKVMSAVVNISSDRLSQGGTFRHPFFDDPFFRRFFEEPGQDDQRQQRLEQSLGSGMIISPDGYVLTNHHVVANAEKVRVSFSNKEEYEAEIIGSDPETDVAVLKIEARDMPYLEFGDSDQLHIGHEVMAFGNPFGVGQTATKGIVSALGRSIGLLDYEDMIQTDATINPGNSGGPLVDMSGRVVGMNTAILSRTGGSQGIGFAIPSNLARRVLTELREHGEVRRAWLGVTIREVDQAMADVYGLDHPRGVLVNTVNDDTPAEKAGLRPEDIILSVDGQEVNTTSELRNRVSLSPIGENVELRILREGRTITKKVRLEALPGEMRTAETRTPEQQDGIPGVIVGELNDRLRQRFTIPEDVDGVAVIDVQRGSDAWRKGLRQGDVILMLNRDSVSDLDDYRAALTRESDKPYFLQVFKPGADGGSRIFLAIERD
ncbi:MAG: Do family serine endopeptidase [Candidatus Krumholzibacteriia bacterium]